VLDSENKLEGKMKYNGLTSRMGGKEKKMRDDFKIVDQTSKSLNLRRNYKK
jgi:hypothetical protein